MNIGLLGRILEKSHRKTRSWNKTGSAFHISGGMAFRIAKEGYDPANPFIRIGLGLGPRVCSKCKRKITIPLRAQKRIVDMEAKDLLWCLEHRKKM